MEHGILGSYTGLVEMPCGRCNVATCGPVFGATKMGMTYEYLTSCVDSTADAINAMVVRAIDVTYRTMLLRCPGLLDWAESVGYERDGRSGGLTLERDWAVSFHRSKYRGKRCYYVRWSAIEHIFVEA